MELDRLSLEKTASMLQNEIVAKTRRSGNPQEEQESRGSLLEAVRNCNILRALAILHGGCPNINEKLSNGCTAQHLAIQKEMPIPCNRSAASANNMNNNNHNNNNSSSNNNNNKNNDTTKQNKKEKESRTCSTHTRDLGSSKCITETRLYCLCWSEENCGC